MRLDLDGLADASREALMSEWRKVVGCPPPKHLSKPEPPHFYWSMSMFRKRRTENGEQATEAGRDCLEVKAS